VGRHVYVLLPNFFVIPCRAVREAIRSHAQDRR
jgi:hypothetical protein